MVIEFKILLKGEEGVLVKGKFPETYSELKKTISTNKKDLGKYVLNINKESVGNLEKIWDEPSYKYFLKKLKVLYSEDKEDKKITLILEELKKDEELPQEFEEPSIKKFALDIIDQELKTAQDSITKALTPMILEDANDLFEENKKKKEDLLKSDEEHKNVVCNKCLEANFKGKRFICAFCNNYNLCGLCEMKMNQTQFHNRDHTFILLNKAVEDNVLEYRNAIVPKEFIIQGLDEFTYEIAFKMVNCGTHDLQECYIAPIQYGSSFLNCDKLSIDEEFNQKEMKEIKLNLKIPDYGAYKGFFRMFTPNGIPFGDILTVNYTVKES